MTSCWPMMTFESSASIRSRASLICSTAHLSNSYSFVAKFVLPFTFVAAEATVAAFASCGAVSMCHRVEDNVNSKRIRFFLGELVEIPFVFALSLPSVAEVCVMADYRHHSAFVVVDSFVVDLACVVADASTSRYLRAATRCLPASQRAFPARPALRRSTTAACYGCKGAGFGWREFRKHIATRHGSINQHLL